MNANNKSWKFITFFIVLVLFLVAGILLGDFRGNEISEEPKGLKLSYYEDNKGLMTFEEILWNYGGVSYKEIQHNALVIGQSRSVWWVRIEGLYIGESGENYFLSVTNPSVEKLVLYVPVNENQKAPYEEIKTGWGFHGNSMAEDFVWPVFKLSKDQLKGKPLFLKITSPYTQNYSIHLLSEKEFEQQKLKNTAFFSLFVGFLLAMGIINLIHYFSLGHTVYLRYVIYITMMILYQCALLGLYHIWLSPKLSDFLISNIIIIGAVTLITSLVFFKDFLDTKKQFPKVNRGANVLLVLSGMQIVLMLFGMRFEASIFSTFVACLNGILILGTCICAVRKGIRQARFFLVGWIFMFFSIMVFALRVYGVIPNSSVTLSVVALCSSIEAIFLSAALDDYIRILRKENAQFELDFLQAQINPHFLFNALNVIATLCRMDAEKARLMILDLSEYMHYSFTTNGLNRLVPLEEEIKFIEAYVRIEQARYPDRIKIIYMIENAEALMIPKLLIQPLVENAIRHGIIKGNKKGNIWVSVSQNNNGFLIRVTDDGAGISVEDLKKLQGETVIGEKTGVGIENVRKRLQRIYRCELRIQSNVNEGTTIEFNLPSERQEYESSFSG